MVKVLSLRFQQCFGPFTINCLCKEKNTFHQQSMDLQKVLRFWKSLWETFRNWILFTGINRYIKGAVFQLWTMCRTMYHVTCRRILWNGTFLHIYLTMFLGVRKFKNTFKISGSFFFFWNSSKLNLNFENAKRNLENTFCFWDKCIQKKLL